MNNRRETSSNNNKKCGNVFSLFLIVIDGRVIVCDFFFLIFLVPCVYLDICYLVFTSLANEFDTKPNRVTYIHIVATAQTDKELEAMGYLMEVAIWDGPE